MDSFDKLIFCFGFHLKFRPKIHSIESHMAMGMGFAIIVNPDEVGTPSESVEFCGAQSLVQGSATDIEDSTNTPNDDPNSGGVIDGVDGVQMMTALVTVLASAVIILA